jgi:hypothetical protein
MDILELRLLWVAHRKIPFPADARGAEVEGVDLVLLDSLAAGCISSIVEQVEQGDSAKLSLLAELAQKIRTVSAHLDGETGRYFARLEKVVEAALHIGTHRQ